MLGDTLTTVMFEEFPKGDDNCTFGVVTQQCIYESVAWAKKELSDPSILESKVFHIEKREYEYIVRINDDEKYDLSQNEQIIVKRNHKYIVPATIDLELGDEMLVYVDGKLEHIEIKSTQTLPKKTDVYLIYREPWGLIIAESMLAYNGCAIKPLTD